MVKPWALRKGDVVGVVAPSDAVEKRDIEYADEVTLSRALEGRREY